MQTKRDGVSCGVKLIAKSDSRTKKHNPYRRQQRRWLEVKKLTLCDMSKDESNDTASRTPVAAV